MNVKTPILIFLFLVAQGFALDPYRVEFCGLDDPDLLAQLKSSSQLVALAETSPTTAAALRRRAESDLQRLITVLHNSAYYNAKISFTYDFASIPHLVTINIELGSIYPLKNFNIIPTEPTSLDYESIRLSKLGIRLNQPAYPSTILAAEECLLFSLAKRGYPYAVITKRDVVANQFDKSIAVTLYVNQGPLTLFGPSSFEGNRSVKDAFLRKKIAWCRELPFDLMKIVETQNALEETRLFRLVNISYPESLSESGKIPMHIALVEAKHRSIGAGVSYSTQLGPGGQVEWEHRNIRGMGDTLRLKANILGRLQEGSVQYIQPDIWLRKQDLVWRADYIHEVTKGYQETAYSLSAILQHRLTPCLGISYGAKAKELRNSGSDRNGCFHLIKTPLTLRWNNTNNLLDPTRGGSFFSRIEPTAQILSPKFVYVKNLFTGTYYKSLWKDPRVVLAAKVTLGTILGTTRQEIPPSERFYAGSESTLRGYKYMTVSPLNAEDKPIGGRSMLIGSCELRWRATEKLGVAYFYDVGNVYRQVLPQFGQRLFHSLGTGIRYYTPVGPIRLDIAFPINRRKGIDSRFQFYFSIGQAF